MSMPISLKIYGCEQVGEECGADEALNSLIIEKDNKAPNCMKGALSFFGDIAHMVLLDIT